MEDLKMATRNEIKVKVCTMMHKLMAQGKNQSEAMKLAWANVKLNAALKTAVVEFEFVKVDGSIRKAHGTLMSDMVPETKTPSNGETDYNVQKYYDTDKGAWRCFKRINLVA